MSLDVAEVVEVDAPPPVEEVPGRGANLRANLVQLARKPVFLVAALYVLFVIVSAFRPRLFTSAGPYDTHPETAMLSPRLGHLFGTDLYGRDLWTRVLYGSPLTIKATLIALAIAIVAGLTLGVVSGFFAGVTDAFLMRFVDVLLAIPGLLLALSTCKVAAVC